MTSTGKEVYESVITQSLEKNMKLMNTWSKYRNELNTVKYLLNLISKKVTNSVMVPIGPKALMPGKIVHTNEYLVNLGETWFVKRSAYQTIEICNRRIKNCAEMLEKLQKERKLIVNKNTLPIEQEAFGNEERIEIIEYISEEEYQKCKGSRRIIKDQHKKQSVDSRMEQKEPTGTYLDEMELQEFENELNKLNSECNIKDVFNEVSQPNSFCVENEKFLQDVKKDIKENLITENRSLKNVNVKKGVTFACDLDSLDNEPLRLEIKHSEVNFTCPPSNKEINSPADIYNNYKKLINKKPISVLKPSIRKSINNTNTNNNNNYNNNNNSNSNSNSNNNNTPDVIKYKVDDRNEEGNFEDNFPVSHGVQLHDISERNVSSIDIVHMAGDSKTKKISKFKASRKKFH